MLWDKDIPDKPEEKSIEEVDPELHRLLCWFIKNRKRVAWSHGSEGIIVGFEGKKDPTTKKEREPYKPVLKVY